MATARRKLPAQRTLEHARKNGWVAQKVETWVPVPSHPGGGVRRDLFGFIDVLVLDGRPGVLAIQCTSSAHVGDHMQKLLQRPQDAPGAEQAWKARLQAMRLWLLAGGRLEVWGWRKAGKAGERKLWGHRVVVITSEMLEEARGAIVDNSNHMVPPTPLSGG